VHDDACKAQWDALDDRAKERYGWVGCGGGLRCGLAVGWGARSWCCCRRLESVCCHVPLGEAAA
jgi:hypothetical protein